MEFLGRKEAKLVAGVAILMMMFHHFFGFSEWLNGNTFIESLTICNISIERMIAAFGKLCVALYAFCTGYVIWKKQEDYLRISLNINRIIRFLFNYWVIFTLFMLYGIAIGDSLPKGVDFFWNLIGLRTGTQMPYVNVAFAWYVTTYLLLMLFSPFFIKIFRGSCLWRDILLYIVIIGMLDLIQKFIWCDSVLKPISVAIFGILVAKWNVFDELNNRLFKCPIWVFLMLIIVVALFRQSLILFNIRLWGIEEGVFACIYIYSVICILKKLSWEWFEKILFYLGYYSMNLWFLHGIFFTGLRPLQKFLYYPQYPVFIYWD